MDDVETEDISLVPQGSDNGLVRGPEGKEAGEKAGKPNGRIDGPCVEDRRLSIKWSLDRSSDVGRALLAATRRLREVSIDTAQLDAAVLLSAVLGVNKAWLYAHPTRALNEPEIARFEDLVRRRMCHEPVAYLVGFKPFYGLDITVDRRVLIPRPETELLVERVLAQAAAIAQDGRRPVIADIGTGSGAIAVAVAVHAPDAIVYATDLSADALEVAAQNVWRYGVGEQVHLLPGYLTDCLPEPADIIVANLPYISTADLAGLPPQVRSYEPILSLDGGVDGCTVIARLLENISRDTNRARLRPGGVIFLEIGADEGQQVRDLVLKHLPHAQCAIHVDYAGLDRIAVLTT